jgi:site-specific DNA recombinase
MTRAAIYARFSTDLQNESSIADQVRVCTEYAKRNGMRVVERFEDKGISGAALGNRPGVLRMQEAALARRFDVLLVVDLSRLSRSQGDLAKMIDRLVHKQIRVVGVQNGYDSTRKGHKLQVGIEAVISESFREMVKERTYAALESRAKEKKPTGGRAYGYDAAATTASGKVEVNREHAAIVREIFERFADGASYKAIAAELNRRNVPSPGSVWTRTERRAGGWMMSAIRSMVLNPIYNGTVRWNTSEWVKNPESGKRERRERPQSEWIVYHDERLRIVSDKLWERAQRRTRLNGDSRIKSGGKVKYLLSGLFVCKECGRHFVLVNSNKYGCGSHVGGGEGACHVDALFKKEDAEAALLDPIRNDLLDPQRVARMAREMQSYFAERTKTQAARASELPKEIQDITDRLQRLRARLQKGDPDMTADEIQAAIDRADAKRQELLAARPEAKQSAKIISLLPKAAELYRRQIAAGLDGDAEAAEKARALVRQLFGGRLVVKAKRDGSVWAEGDLHPVVLLRAATGRRDSGSGGRI